MMNKFFSRLLALLLAVSLLLGAVPAQAARGSDQHLRAVQLYEESFRSDNYYTALTDETVYSYKAWAQYIDERSSLTQAWIWAANTLLGNHLTEDAYIDYLCELMAMMDSNFDTNTAALEAYNQELDLLALSGNLVGSPEGTLKLTVYDIFSDKLKDLENTHGKLGLTLNLTELINKSITDAEQLKVLTLATVHHDQKLLVLKEIMANAQDKNLRDAAQAMIHVSNAQYLYMLDNYTGDLVKNTWGVYSTITGDDMLKTVFPKMIDNVSKKLTPWLTKHMGKSVGAVAGKVLGAVGKYGSCIFAGLSIGAGIGKLIYGEEAELFREMMAMDRISDALIQSFRNAKNTADSGDMDQRLHGISKFVVIGRALIDTHLRGEFRFIQVRERDDQKNVEEMEAKWSQVKRLMNEYRAVLDSFFQGGPHGGKIRQLTGVDIYQDGELYCRNRLFYNEQGQLIREEAWYPLYEVMMECTYTYDDAGRLLKADRGNFLLYYLSDIYTYNEQGQLTCHQNYWGNNWEQDLYYQENYEYDSQGRLVRQDYLTPDYEDGVPDLFWTGTFTHDAQGRVITRTQWTEDGEEYGACTFAYDDSGRLIRDELGQYSYDYPPFVVSHKNGTIENVSLRDPNGQIIWNLRCLYLGDMDIFHDSEGYIIRAEGDYSAVDFFYDCQETAFPPSSLETGYANRLTGTYTSSNPDITIRITATDDETYFLTYTASGITLENIPLAYFNCNEWDNKMLMFILNDVYPDYPGYVEFCWEKDGMTEYYFNALIEGLADTNGDYADLEKQMP